MTEPCIDEPIWVQAAVDEWLAAARNAERWLRDHNFTKDGSFRCPSGDEGGGA